MTAISSSTRSWQVNPAARLMATGEDLLVRHGGLVTRCTAPGIRPFVTALLDTADDGRVDLDAAELDPVRLARFERLMTQLVAAGLFIELDPGEAAADPVVLGLWQRGGGTVERSEIASRLRTRPVRVVGTGALAGHLRRELAAAGLTVGPADGGQAGVAVVVGAHEQDPVLTDWNTFRLAEGTTTPWLAVTPFDGEYATVGPWVVPGESACYACYLLRRASTFTDEAVTPVLAEAEAAGPAVDGSSRHPGLRLVQTGLVVDRLTEYTALGDRGGQSVPGGLTTIAVRPDAIEIQRHRVLRVPRCPTCSPAAGRGYPQVWYAEGSGA